MGFDWIAPHYRWLEFVLAGEKLQRCRTEFLGEVEGCTEVLSCGEGNGRFLAECRARLPQARITCLDASPRMLSSAARRVENGGGRGEGIEFICADALSWDAPVGRFDLIVTHFFLDCFEATQIGAVIEKLSRAAKAETWWLLADFRVPAAGLPRWRALWIHRLMYWFFRWTTGISAGRIVAPEPFLSAAGFQVTAGRTSEWGLLRSELWRRNGSAVSG